MRRTTVLVVSMFALTLCAGHGAAQSAPPPDTLKVDYFANAHTTGVPDGTLLLTNPGTSGGNICAAIFVIDVHQELSECCSCFLSPDGLRTLSVNTDLTGNPLTGVTLSTGSIRMVSTSALSGGACPYADSLTPKAAIRPTVQITVTTAGSTGRIERASQDATLSATEQTRLQNECHAVRLDGSGKGVCSCGTGD